MANMMHDTINAAKNGVESAKEGTMHAIETAKNGVESAKDGTMHAIGAAKQGVESAKVSTLHTMASGVAMVLKGVTATAGVFAALRKLDTDDGLAWFGLARRRSPLMTVAAFGAGAAMGAGIALLFAPTSGAEMRKSLVQRFKAEGAVAKIESRMEDAIVAVKGAVEETKHPAAGATHAAAGAPHVPAGPPHNGKPTPA